MYFIIAIMITFHLVTISYNTAVLSPFLYSFCHPFRSIIVTHTSGNTGFVTREDASNGVALMRLRAIKVTGQDEPELAAGAINLAADDLAIGFKLGEVALDGAFGDLQPFCQDRYRELNLGTTWVPDTVHTHLVAVFEQEAAKGINL